MWIYIWTAVTILALIVEVSTSEMVSIWFAGGGLVSIILASFGLEWYVTFPAFVIVSTLLLIFFRKLIIAKFNKGEEKLNADSLIGRECRLEESISFGNAGAVKVKGVVWTAITENDKETVEKGTIVKIIKIEGNKLIVEEVK